MPVFCQRDFACGETARAVIGPAFWVCRAKSGAAFRCAKPPCAVVRFAAMTSSPRTDVLACPAFALLSHSPTALLNTPALVAVRLHFACAKPRWSVVAPAGGNVLAPPFSLRSNVAPRSHPGPCSRSVAFRLRQNRAGRSSAPPFGVAAQNRARHFAAHSLGGRPLRGHGFAAPHRHFPLPAAAAPTTA